MKIYFAGGPWNGQSREKAKRPEAWACKTDADKAGMKGIYRALVGTDNKMYWVMLP